LFGSLPRLRIRDWKDTRTLVDKALATSGDNFGKAYLWRGMAYSEASDAQKALQDLSKALQKNPNLHEAYKFRGNIFGMMKNYDQSVTDLTKFLEFYPEEVPELYNRGLSYANLKRLPEAVADFNRAIELDTTFARVYRARGNCLIELGETEKGNADLKKYDSMK
jgi:tetratricopeptide (TPR) repeat protein